MAVQMRFHAFHGQDPSGVFNYLADIMCACYSVKNQKGASTWHFTEFMISHALGAIKVQLTVSFNGANNYEGLITINAMFVDHLLRYNAFENDIAKVHETKYFNQTLLIP